MKNIGIEKNMEKFKDIKNIIFDFDGVICQSQEYHLNKLNKLFDLDFTMEEYAGAHHGNANEVMLVQEKWKKVDWNKYHEEIEKDFPLKKIKPEVKKTLEELAQKYNLFIISSGHNQHIIDFLKNNEVWTLFKRALFFEDAKLKVDKFKMLENEFGISPEDTVFVTDTIGDVREAREVGYKNLIGITTGHHDEEILKTDDNEKNGEVKVIHSFDKIKDLLD